MPVTWSTEQVLDLAPDETSRKNAGTLALPRRWRRFHQSHTNGQHVIWGECQGSGSDPYRCQVDLNGPAYTCSCPSRKVPCKHSLGLFLLYAGQPSTFETASPPDWVAAWLAKRADLHERRAAKAQASTADGDHKQAQKQQAKAQAQAKRASERDQKIRAGLDDLETWLHDLLRQGLIAAQGQPRAFWESTAARLVDAQAPGLARLVRALPGIAASGEGWQERMIAQVGRLYLALEGYRRIDTLPAPEQADLRTAIGFVLKQEDLMGEPGLSDTWLVLGREVEEDAGLRAQRVWLWGQATNRPALILSFAQGSGSTSTGKLDASLSPGMALSAELVFYPSAYPARAVVRTRGPAEALPADMPGCDGLLEATAGYAAALARSPWIERYPVAVRGVCPVNTGGGWAVIDREGRRVPLAPRFTEGWAMLAISGGRPIDLFGEWNGETLLPLSVWNDDGFYAFRPRIE